MWLVKAVEGNEDTGLFSSQFIGEVPVAAHVAMFDVCQRVKAEHQRPDGLLHPLKIPEWKWE